MSRRYSVPTPSSSANGDRDSMRRIIDGDSTTNNNVAAENEDVHVRELRRMFDSCDSDGDGALSANGLERLCQELRLDDHKAYVVDRLLPAERSTTRRSTIAFDSFKHKFIQLLPDIVDLSVSEAKTAKTAAQSPQIASRNNHLRVSGNHDSVSNTSRPSAGKHSQNRSYRVQQHHRIDSKPIAAPRRRLFVLDKNPMEEGDGVMLTMTSDQDTSNDILSEFTDDERPRVKQREDDGIIAQQKRRNRSSLGSDSAASSNASSACQQSPSTRPSDVREEEAAAAAATASSTATITASDVEQILNGLGLADRGYLGRYEFRILCQHLGLNGLTPSELNGLFNQLDKDGDGRIAVDDFLLVCPTSSTTSHRDDQHSPPSPAPPAQSSRRRSQCQGSSPRQQVSSSSVRNNEDDDEQAAGPCLDEPTAVEKNGGGGGDDGSTLNDSSVANYAPLALSAVARNVREKMKNLRTKAVTILACLDESRTGHAKRDDVLRYWETLGVEDGCEVLKKLGFSQRHRWIDLKELSSALDRELCEHVEHESSLLAAVLTLKAEVCFLGELFEESREQASHYLRELQLLNQRNAILVEEMDQSQQNLEIRSQMQLKELEEKHQSRVNTLESKYRDEREQWISEIKEKEEFVHKLEQSESTLQSRLRQVERENSKLRTEVDDLAQMMKDVEELNRDLRQALKDSNAVKKQRQSSVENVLSSMGGQPWTASASNRTGLSNGNAGGEEALRKIMGLENGGGGGTRTGLVIHRSSTNGKSSALEANSIGCCRCASTSSTPAKKRVKYTPPSTSALLKRRRLQLHHQNHRSSGGQIRPLDSSDFESEPEPLMFKPKFKRPLKKRQRLALIANRDSPSMLGVYDHGNVLFAGVPSAAASAGRVSSSTSTDEDQQQQQQQNLASMASIGGGSFSQYGQQHVDYCNGSKRNAEAPVGFYYRSGIVGSNSNRENQFPHLAAFERRLSDERKFYAQELKVEIAAMEEEHARESHRLLERFEREKEQLKNECKRELESLLHSATSEKRAALEQQETELRRQFDEQRRDAEIKWATERNVMERRFAEDKMEMMERLQNDFEAELNRLRSAVSNRSHHHENGSTSATSMENRLRFEQALQENQQLNAQLENLRSELRVLNDQVADERNRNANLDGQVGDVKRELAFWESKYNEANRENLALHDETKRIERDLRDVSMELSVVQQRAEEFERRRLEETTQRINSSDADVQTDRSSLVPVKDESVQSESPTPDLMLNGGTIDPISAMVAYERIHESLSKGVKELELLLQSGESGFEEEETTVEEEAEPRIEIDDDPVVLKSIYGKLRKRFSMAHAKFEEIRTELVGEAACLNEIRLSGDQTDGRASVSPTCTTSNQHRETQTDDEDERGRSGGDRIVYDIREEDEENLDFDEEMEGILVGDDDDKTPAAAIDCPSNASPAIVAQMTERLRDENFLLKARLLEQKRLTGQLTDRLQEQMRDTVKVSEVAQKLFARCKSMESKQQTPHIL